MCKEVSKIIIKKIKKIVVFFFLHSATQASTISSSPGAAAIAFAPCTGMRAP